MSVTDDVIVLGVDGDGKACRGHHPHRIEQWAVRRTPEVACRLVKSVSHQQLEARDTEVCHSRDFAKVGLRDETDQIEIDNCISELSDIINQLRATIKN